jgi:hypothetical protein
MVRRISTTFLALFSLVFIFSSCTKGNDIIANQNDITGTWAVVGISSNISYDWNGDGYSETDIYGSYSYCQRDIVLSFEENGNGQSRQGCNSSWLAMFWQLSNNNRTLHISMSEGDLDLNILRFTSNSIVGEDNVYMNGRNYTITYTLARR